MPCTWPTIRWRPTPLRRWEASRKKVGRRTHLKIVIFSIKFSPFCYSLPRFPAIKLNCEINTQLYIETIDVPSYYRLIYLFELLPRPRPNCTLVCHFNISYRYRRIRVLVVKDSTIKPYQDSQRRPYTTPETFTIATRIQSRRSHVVRSDGVSDEQLVHGVYSYHEMAAN